MANKPKRCLRNPLNCNEKFGRKFVWLDSSLTLNRPQIDPKSTTKRTPIDPQSIPNRSLIEPKTILDRLRINPKSIPHRSGIVPNRRTQFEQLCGRINFSMSVRLQQNSRYTCFSPPPSQNPARHSSQTNPVRKNWMAVNIRHAREDPMPNPAACNRKIPRFASLSLSFSSEGKK